MIIVEQSCDLSEAVLQENGFVSGVKICGLESRNGRIYPPTVLQEAMPLYEGAPCFVSHSDRPDYNQHIGVVHPTEVKASGLYGTWELKPKHPLFESILWDLQHKSRDIGLSHVVEADLDGKTVRKIHQVKSVDLVVDPATTRSLVEQIEQIEKTEPGDEAVLSLILEELRSSKTLYEQVLKELGDRGDRASVPVARIPEAPPARMAGGKFDPRDWVAKVQYWSRHQPGRVSIY